MNTVPRSVKVTVFLSVIMIVGSTVWSNVSLSRRIENVRVAAEVANEIAAASSIQSTENQKLIIDRQNHVKVLEELVTKLQSQLNK